MNDAQFEHYADLAGKGHHSAALEIIAEARRLRALVQCCPRDNDYDGNCRIHSGKGYPQHRGVSTSHLCLHSDCPKCNPLHHLDGMKDRS